MAGARGTSHLARARTGAEPCPQQRRAPDGSGNAHGIGGDGRRALAPRHRRSVRHRRVAPPGRRMPRHGATGQQYGMPRAGARRAQRPARGHGRHRRRGHPRHAYAHLHRRQTGPAHGEWPRLCGRSGSGRAGHRSRPAACGEGTAGRPAPVRPPVAAAPAEHAQGQLRQRGHHRRRARHGGRAHPGGAHGPARGRGTSVYRLSRHAARV